MFGQVALCVLTESVYRQCRWQTCVDHYNCRLGRRLLVQLCHPLSVCLSHRSHHRMWHAWAVVTHDITQRLFLVNTSRGDISGDDVDTVQGFMQDQIIASHMFWWTRGWMLTVKPVYKLSNCAWWPEMGYKHTFDTIYTHFQGITNNIYDFGRPFFCSYIFFYPSSIFLPVHRPYSFLPIQMTGGRVSR